jgi:hypothetical protein
MLLCQLLSCKARHSCCIADKPSCAHMHSVTNSLPSCMHLSLLSARQPLPRGTQMQQQHQRPSKVSVCHVHVLFVHQPRALLDHTVETSTLLTSI